MQCDIGVVGLGVMGSNLALNMERNGFRVAGYDLDGTKAKTFVEKAAGKNVALADSPASLMAMLQKPRRVLLMVPAGSAVDSAIAHLKGTPRAGGYPDRRRQLVLPRHRAAEQGAGGRGVQLCRDRRVGRRAGCALGPEHHAWRADGGVGGVGSDPAGHCGKGGMTASRASEHMGPGGAGHFVKMVHNGIEYGDMQLIAETYDLLSRRPRPDGGPNCTRCLPSGTRAS